MAEPDWSLLPSDTLEQISKLVVADSDHIRFRSVCASWRRSAPKRPQLPCLILFRRRPRNGPLGGNIVFTFCKLSFDGAGGVEIVPNPNLPESDLPIGISCIGSFHGYISLVGDGSHSILLTNPLTNSEIHLPKPPIPGGRCNVIAVSSNPATSSDFAALADSFLYQGGGGDDDGWTPLQCPRFGQARVQSCCWCRGRFYLASSGEVYVCDLGPVPRVRTVASLTRESVGLPWISMARLVESDGDLLLVLEYRPPRAPTQGYSFAVFKLELGEELTKLGRLDDLGDKALFLSHHNGLSLSASRFRGCKANDIYYDWSYYDPDRRTLTNKLKVYNLKDRSDGLINDDAILHLGNWESFAWYTPSL